jgi:hypothetical protein
MRVETLTHRIAQLPRRTRHIVASIVAWRMSPEEPQGMSQEWRDRANEWAGIWALAKDHGTHYKWPSNDELRDALREVGIAPRIIADAIAMYDSHGEPETAARNTFRFGYYRAHGTKPQEKPRVDRKYEWSAQA